MKDKPTQLFLSPAHSLFCCYCYCPLCLLHTSFKKGASSPSLPPHRPPVFAVTASTCCTLDHCTLPFLHFHFYSKHSHRPLFLPQKIPLHVLPKCLLPRVLTHTLRQRSAPPLCFKLQDPTSQCTSTSGFHNTVLYLCIK